MPWSATQKTGSSASVPTPAAVPPLALRSSATAISDSSAGATETTGGSFRHGTATAAQTIATASAAAQAYPVQSTRLPIGTSTNPSRAVAANGVNSRTSRRSRFIAPAIGGRSQKLNL